MYRSSRKILDSSLLDEAVELLFSRIKKIKDSSELQKFLADYFPVSNRDMLLRKFAIAVLLFKKMKYRDIGEKLEVSRTTISKAFDIAEDFGYGQDPERHQQKPRAKVVVSKPKRKRYKLRYKGVRVEI